MSGLWIAFDKVWLTNSVKLKPIRQNETMSKDDLGFLIFDFGLRVES